MDIKIAKSMAISLTVSIASFLAVCPSHAKYRNSEQLKCRSISWHYECDVKYHPENPNRMRVLR